jgi:hypothetical protein
MVGLEHNQQPILVIRKNHHCAFLLASTVYSGARPVYRVSAEQRRSHSFDQHLGPPKAVTCAIVLEWEVRSDDLAAHFVDGVGLFDFGQRANCAP